MIQPSCGTLNLVSSARLLRAHDEEVRPSSRKSDTPVLGLGSKDRSEIVARKLGKYHWYFDDLPSGNQTWRAGKYTNYIQLFYTIYRGLWLIMPSLEYLWPFLVGIIIGWSPGVHSFQSDQSPHSLAHFNMEPLKNKQMALQNIHMLHAWNNLQNLFQTITFKLMYRWELSNHTCCTCGYPAL